MHHGLLFLSLLPACLEQTLERRAPEGLQCYLCIEALWVTFIVLFSVFLLFLNFVMNVIFVVYEKKAVAVTVF